MILIAAMSVAVIAAACSASEDANWAGPVAKGGSAGTAGGAGSAGAAGTAGTAGAVSPDASAGTAGEAGSTGTGGSSGGALGGSGGSGDDASVDQSVADVSEEPIPDVSFEVCFQYTCTPDGRSVLDCWNNVVQTCGATEVCQNGYCKSACMVVENDQSSVGCKFAAIDLDEHHGGSCFVAMVANTWPSNAHVTVRRWDGAQMAVLPAESFTKLPAGSGAAISYEPYSAVDGIPPGQVALLFLSGAAGGGVACPSGITPAVAGSAVLKGTGLAEGFEIETDVPIVAYQINPYGGGQAAVTGASLLLPNSAWGQGYIAMNAYSSAPIGTHASLNVVANEDDTDVTFTPVAAVAGGNGVPGSAAKAPFTVKLRRAQYMQISQSAELTGSIVTANRKIGMFAGHQCAQIPVGASYCDHIEQMIPPVRAFGSEYVAVPYEPRGTNDPTRWRFVGAADGTTVQFDPAVTAPITLNKGSWTEIVSQQPFVARSQDSAHAFFVAAYMTGSSQVSGEFQGDDSGDPEMVNIIPPQQYLKKYVFLSDATYPTTNLVVVRKQPFADVSLDCAGVLGGWQNIDSQGQYQFTRTNLVHGNFQPQGACDNGVHNMESSEPFGLWVWAWGYQGTSKFTANVSYGYPAGANVSKLNDLMD